MTTNKEEHFMTVKEGEGISVMGPQFERESPQAKIAAALCKAQAVMSGAKKDKKNPYHKSTYADLASVFEAIRKPFADNDLAVSQVMDILPNGEQVIYTNLLHTSGEFIESKMLLPKETNPQKMGSNITYLRRFMLMAIAGLPPVDDDGNAAAGIQDKTSDATISTKQLNLIDGLINGNEKVRAEVLKHCDGNLSNITVERFPGAMEWVKDLIANPDFLDEEAADV